MRRATPWILSLTALVAAVSWPRPTPAQDSWDAMSQRFDATWVLAGSRSSARRTVNAAVDEAVSHMNMLLRGVAAPMIRDNTPVNYEIELRFRSGSNIFVRFDDRVRYTTPLNATRGVRTHTGDPIRLTQRFRGEELEQVFQADNGTRWNTYSILANGHMRMVAVTQGSMMPEPMRFTLEYRRQE